MRITNLLLALSALAGLAVAQDSMTDAGAGWTPEFKMAGRQIIALAEAIPAEKYGWRPGSGVRSVSEVLMHTASGNYFFLRSMGVKAGDDLPKNAETAVRAKADVVRWLKASFDSVLENDPKIDKQKAVKFLGHDATCEGVLLRALAHGKRAPGADDRVCTDQRRRAALVKMKHSGSLRRCESADRS